MGYYKAAQYAHNRDSEGEDKEEGIENTFEEIMAENFQNIKETDIKIEDSKSASASWTQTGPLQDIL